MKFIHLGDVHLGAKPDSGFPWSKERAMEIWNRFQDIINICNRQEIDLLLIAGDFFHRQPLVRELKEANYILSKLVNTKVVIIAGNHDYISPRSNYRNFTWCDHVHMLTKDSMDSIYFEEINTEVFGLSYHTREIKEPILDNVTPNFNERINILLAHGGTPTDIPFDKNTLVGNGFDYIALGHIHTPKILGDRIAYTGSFEPMDKNETGERGYIQGEITKVGMESSIGFQFVSSAARQYINIDLPVHETMTNSELKDLAKEKLRDYEKHNIFIFNLIGYRDPDITFDLESLRLLGNIIDVKDQTMINYDFEQLSKENQDNIIGSFITSIMNYDGDENITKKALYYGMEALLHAKE